MTGYAQPSHAYASGDRTMGERGIRPRVFLLCFAVAMLDGFDTQAMAFVAPTLRRAWGLTPIALGTIFAFSGFGAILGSLGFGLLTDRIGRRPVTIVTVALFGIATLACAFAPNADLLIALRFIGGIGMGGALPNVLALAAESASEHRRALVVTATLWGFPGGAVLGGVASAWLITIWGWPSVFWLGGFAPLLLLAALIPALPESPGFVRLAERKGTPAAGRGPGLAQLFAPGLASASLLLAAAMLVSLFMAYLLLNWVPTLLAMAGMSTAHAILGAVAINLGGVAGSYLVARRADRMGGQLPLIAAGFVVSGLAIAVTGRLPTTPMLTLTALAACGVCLIGSQMALSTYTTLRYPVALRGLGLGWVQAVGKLGSLLGPMAGGIILSAGIDMPTIFTLALIPAGVAALLLVGLAFADRTISSQERKSNDS